MYQPLELPIKCRCGMVVIQFHYSWNKTILYFLLVPEAGFQHSCTRHTLYSYQLPQVLNSGTIKLIIRYEKWMIWGGPGKYRNYIPSWVLVFLEEIVTTTVPQYFPIQILTHCDLFIMTDLQTLIGIMISKQQHFSDFNLAIGMGSQFWGLSGKNM